MQDLARFCNSKLFASQGLASAKSWSFKRFRNGQFATLLMEPQADSQAENRSLSLKFSARPRSASGPSQPEVKPLQLQVEFDCQAADERPLGLVCRGPSPGWSVWPGCKRKKSMRMSVDLPAKGRELSRFLVLL